MTSYFLVAALCYCPSGSGDIFPPFFARMNELFAATIKMSDGDRGSATAFVVGRKNDSLYLLTADHAVDAATLNKTRFEFTGVHRKGKPPFVLSGAKPLVRRPIADLALLELPIDKAEIVPVLKLLPPGTHPKKFPFEGYSFGYSDGGELGGQSENLLGKRLAVRKDDEMAFFWQADKDQARGRSGGPLLDAEGRVIGICAATALGKGYYVHASEIHAALKTEGYDWLWKIEPTGK